MPEIRIASVGDIMVKRYIISDAKLPNGVYSFDRLLKKVTPYLKKADLVIGNLETTFATKKGGFTQKSRGPLFRCPDELAPALRRAGFDVLTTANNHCMDFGAEGVFRTLRVLDKNGIQHTGTFYSEKRSKKKLIWEIKGIKVGILAYTNGLNGIPVPPSKPWIVNLIRTKKIIEDIRNLKKHVDILIVYLHFGKEYSYSPNMQQNYLVNLLFKHGANIVLGSHPHVLQPLNFRGKKQFVIYSLGNFISTKLLNNPHTKASVILNISVKKDREGKTSISGIQYIPTLVQRRIEKGRMITEVIPIREALNSTSPNLNKTQREKMKKLLKHIVARLGKKARRDE